MDKKISKATLSRLPFYYRTLKKFEETGKRIVSSNELANILEFTPEQIRKDFADVGQFGVKGEGYRVDKLKRGIEKILGLQYTWQLAIVGVGNLGMAVANHKDFQKLGFNIRALFDVDEELIGKKINDVKIFDFADLNDVVRRKIIDIGVITVPDDQAQIVADSLIDAGIRGIWNFASVKLNVPPEITVVNEDLSTGLLTLSYRLKKF